ncbi:MAG: carbohydrate binding domain-containing protein, partial [Pirellulaceae bacterium]|nr:carbohydrate binding domain-containing protein [Pirellulaceae bacterium]
MCHRTGRAVVFLSLLTGWLVLTAAAGDELVVNGGFERGRTGWSEFWSRTPGGTAVLDAERVHGGKQALRVEHTGSQDWSFPQQRKLDVQPDQIYELTGWLWVEGSGDATLSVILYDAQNDAIDWSYGGQTVKAADRWQPVRSRFLIPRGAATIVPRLMGTGPATVWLDDADLKPAGSVQQMRNAELPAKLAIANPVLQVTLQTADGTLAVTDRRTKQTWQQRADAPIIVLDAKP